MNRYLLLAIICLSGCSVGPDYVQPELSLPIDWDAGRSLQSETGTAESIRGWRLKFEDATLNSLIERAIQDNLDLRQAALRIDQARASVTISTARFFPQLGLEGDIRRQSTEISGGDTGTVYRTLTAGGLDALWEIDLFGGIRRDREAALASLTSSEENFYAVRLELVSSVALNYLEFRALQEQIRIIERTLELRSKRAQLVEQRFQGGLSNAFDLTSAKADYFSLQSRLAPIRARADELVYSLSVLLGRNPAELKNELSLSGKLPDTKMVDGLLLPAEVISRRPDLRRLEAELEARTAEVGVATAELYPKFSLTGTFNLQRVKIGTRSDDNTTWNFGPAVTLPIFNAGRLRAALLIQEAEQEIALQAYQAGVLEALKEVETALTKFGEEQERRANLILAVEENRKAVSYAEKMFANGLSDYFAVIQIQARLLESEEQLLNSRLNLNLFKVALYKALGGGW